MNLSEQEVLKAFPAPSFRKYQKEAVIKITDAFNSGMRCVIIDGPTGFGKSYVNATFCKVMQSFYSTPQLTLIDQIKNDSRLHNYFVDIKGRQNYVCYHDFTRTCNIGLCKQYKDFKCDKARLCPYWQQKLKALDSNSVLMSFAYLILEGKTETQYSFGQRKLLVLDESHSIDRYALNEVNLIVSPYTLPYTLYENIRNSIPSSFKDRNDLKYFIQALLTLVETEKEKYEYKQTTIDGSIRGGRGGGGMTLGDTIALTKLEDFESKAQTFLDSLTETEWVWQIDYTTYKGVPSRKIVAQPLYAKFFMKDMVWNKAELFIVSSATILNAERYIREVGLDRAMPYKDIYRLKIPSTFPVANRPIIDVSVGKMTKDERANNTTKAIEMLEGIFEIEKGNNIAVHARSYEFAKLIEDKVSEKYKSLLITHDAENREEQLEKWKKGGGIFICVAFSEGQDWKDEICKAQVLFKVPYPDLSDRRVAKRLELREWSWYFDTTLKETIQEYGRACRSEYDKARFYIVDSSFWTLMKRSKNELPDWFAEALPIGWEKLGEKKEKKVKGVRTS